MKLQLTVVNDDGSEVMDIGTFDHVEDLRKWTEDVADEDVFEEES